MRIVKVDGQGRISLRRVVKDTNKYEYYKAEEMEDGVIRLSPIADEEVAMDLVWKEAEKEMDELKEELISKGEF